MDWCWRRQQPTFVVTLISLNNDNDDKYNIIYHIAVESVRCCFWARYMPISIVYNRGERATRNQMHICAQN